MTSLPTLYDEQRRHGADVPGLRRETTPHLHRELPEEGSYWITWSDLDGLSDAAIDAVITREAARATSLGRAVEWKVHATDAPSNLVARLARHGFRPGEPETLLAGDVAAILDGLDAPPTTVRHLGRPDLADMLDVYRVVWPGESDRVLRMIDAYLAHDPSCVDAVAAYDAGRPVSAGWTTYRSGSPFAELWGGATLPEARGRGHYRAVIAVRLREAQRRERRHVVVDAAPTSRPILERAGFRQLTVTTPCIFDPHRQAHHEHGRDERHAHAQRHGRTLPE